MFCLSFKNAIMALKRKEERSDDDEIIIDRERFNDRGHISKVRVSASDGILHDDPDTDGDLSVIDAPPKRRLSPSLLEDNKRIRRDQSMQPDFADVDNEKDNDDSSSSSSGSAPDREARGLFRDAACRVADDQYLSLIFEKRTGSPKHPLTKLCPERNFKELLLAKHRYSDNQAVGDVLDANIWDTNLSITARMKEVRELAVRVRQRPGPKAEFLLSVVYLRMYCTHRVPVFCFECKDEPIRFMLYLFILSSLWNMGE